MSSSLGGKTAVSYLQEYLILKSRTVPYYELVHNGVGTRNPTFTFRVHVGEQWQDGTAGSKQEAKHRAAENMLKALKIVSPDENETTKLTPDNCEEDKNENYVGLLKEYCIGHLYPDPKYDLEEVAGPAHSRVFKMICCVSQLMEFGVALTKKKAKHQAACKMLKRLKELSSQTGNFVKDSCATQEVPEPREHIKIPMITLTDEEITSKYNSVKYLTVPVKEPAVLYRDHHKAYEGLEETSPTLLGVLKNEHSVDKETALDLLQEIAKELEVSITWNKVPTKPENDLIVMMLSVIPPLAEIGDNRFEAACSLLNTLVCFCT